ncbi:MAG: hypothetical protein K2P76_02145 [Lachnospiraceae bacterium]|nr:hypothetical protein [Lachnospiraceae bacterium]MDE6981429.1 hypothetical protein [Lachnospiraceae bacterium]
MGRDKSQGAGKSQMDEKQDFSMEEYIEKRMMEITDLDQRRMFKQTVGDILSAVYAYSKEAFDKLENDILKECQGEQNRYAVYISMTDKEHYDATDTFLYPMRDEDTKEENISCQEIKETLGKGEEVKLFTVFLKDSATRVYSLLNQRERYFSGCIKTLKGEYRGVFLVRQNREYLKMIEELYVSFGVNFKPWLTVCTAYLTKLLDVYLYSMEGTEDEEEIQEIEVDFEEFASCIEYRRVPLWNLKPIKEKTSTYPNPCIDKINYEHQFFSQRLRPDCGYLVRDAGVEITNIRRINGDLYITCPIPRPCDWHLYEVHQNEKMGNYPYPVLSNQYKDTFSGSITEMYKKSIKTRGEMARLMESFEYGDYLVFSDFEILSSVPEECIPCNYNMDSFMEDEIRTGNQRAVLVICFEARDEENYLNEDIMSFLVTQVQRIFPDYCCVGKIVKGGSGG